MLDFRKKVYIGLLLILIVIVMFFMFSKKHSDPKKDPNREIQNIGTEQFSDNQNQNLIDQVTNMDESDVDTGSISFMLQQQKNSNYDTCLNLSDQVAIKACIEQKEKSIVENMGEYTLDNCKKLVFYKDRCLNLLYYQKAKQDTNSKFCEYITDKSMGSLCTKSVSQISQRETARKAVLQKEDEKVKTSLSYISTSKSVNDCKTLAGDLKLKCVYKFVTQDKDLRYCNTYFDKTNAALCINNNWVDVVSYNLAKVKDTKDKTYCEKIYIAEWKTKCLNEIK